MSAGYLVFLAKNFSSIMLPKGCFVSVQLPSFYRTLGERPFFVDGLSSQ